MMIQCSIPFWKRKFVNVLTATVLITFGAAANGASIINVFRRTRDAIRKKNSDSRAVKQANLDRDTRDAIRKKDSDSRAVKRKRAAVKRNLPERRMKKKHVDGARPKHACASTDCSALWRKLARPLISRV